MSFVQELESKRFELLLILEKGELSIQFNEVYRLQKT
jgi:plasmid maintenance system killer protein